MASFANIFQLLQASEDDFTGGQDGLAAPWSLTVTLPDGALPPLVYPLLLVAGGSLLPFLDMLLQA